MENIKSFFEFIWGTQIINSIVIVAISIILYKSLSYFINKSDIKTESLLSGKGRTYIKLTKNILRYVFIGITIIILLQVNGVDVSSVLAGLGIVGVVLGLSIQDWLKDIIRGASIISDNYFSVGDIVNYKGTEGKVLVIGLKSTKIQDLKTGNVKSIANRNIDEIDVVSNLIYVSVPLSYELPVEEAEAVIYDIANSIKENDNVTDCRYISVNEILESAISYYLRIECNQLYKLQVKRDALRTILVELEKKGISIPYTQIDIHEK